MKQPFVVLNTDTTKLERAAWLILRRQGIGSSDAAACLGLSPWQSRYSLWCDKRALTPLDDDNDRLHWKVVLEEPIWERYAADNLQTTTMYAGKVLRHHMLRSTEYPFMTANPDGLVIGREVVEIKTTHSMDAPRWDLGIPEHYVLQCTHLMIVTGERHCILPVMHGNDVPRYFHLDYDPEIADMLVQAELTFWEDVIDNVEPDVDSSEASMHAVRERYRGGVQGYEVEATEVIDRLVERAQSAMWNIKQDTAEVSEAKATIMNFMGEAERLVYNGETLATWRANKAGARVLRFTQEGK